MFCRLLSFLSIKFYRLVEDRVHLHVLPITVNHINTIVPCANGQVSAASSAGYCQSYQYNSTLWFRTGISCMFCMLLSILSIQLYRLVKDRVHLHVLPVTVNPINTIVPCTNGQVSAASAAGYCQSYQYNCTVWFRTGFSCMFCMLLSILSIQLYRLGKDRYQLHVLQVSVNPITTIVPCAEGQVPAACSACYCQ